MRPTVWFDEPTPGCRRVTQLQVARRRWYELTGTYGVADDRPWEATHSDDDDE